MQHARRTIYMSSESLWRDVSHCREHGDAAVLDFSLATTLEVLHASVGRKTGGVPKSNRILDTELVLEGTQRRGGVVGPITPRTASESILHIDNALRRAA